ncbi:hypothetical protein [Corynebacterium terpenotabidum]|uniref:hypothetical protein n=1 Tax=Corynebacterium terpenotabidum TaxID=89154 RepID=UPI000A012ACA|nr:hypothetical protein [Corynebacterium terpenotabidum]
MSAQQLPQRQGGIRGRPTDGACDGLAAVLELPGLVHPGPPVDAADHELTLLVLAEHHVPGLGWFTRALGITGALSVADTVRAVLISLDWPGASTMLTPDQVPPGTDRVLTWSLQARRDDRLRVYSRTAGSIGTPLREALGRDGTGLLVVDGYTVTVTSAGAMHRDGHTPDAVCLAGGFTPDTAPGQDATETPGEDAVTCNAPGEVDHPVGLPRDVDLAAVNVALTGEETVTEILGELDPELHELLLSGDLYEFTPLLQALDLGRPAQISEQAHRVLEQFPAETSRVGRAAAWSRVVALSALSDRATSDEVTAMLMAALGFTRADAGISSSDGRLSTDPLSAAEIRALSRESGRLLAMCGADSRDVDLTDGAGEMSRVIPLVPTCSLVDRLEMYRFLLQK